MESMFELLGKLQEGDAARALSRRLGMDERATGGAVAAALPVLIGALSRNASQGSGAQALSDALARDHDGTMLDDLVGALGRSTPAQGDGILGHVLGARRSSVEARIGRRTGLDAASVGQLLATLAPMVMGALGRAQRERGLDAGGLSEALGAERDRVGATVPGGLDAFERLLDTDGDGDIKDDLVKLGTSVLGSLFGGRR